MKTIQIKIYFFIALLFPSVGFAELDTKFREEFPNVVKDLCHSTLSYALDSPFEEVSAEYHKTINCLFDDAFAESSKRIFKEVGQETSGKGTEGLVKAPEFANTGVQCTKKASEIRRLQEANGLITRCIPSSSEGDANEYKTVREPYSACRVGEVVLTEWCGYQKYLWGKTNDDASFRNEYEKQILTPQDWDRLFTQQKNHYKYESEKARKGLLETINLYQKYEQNYRFHAWLKAMENRFKENKSLWGKLRTVFDLYPEKFINAATP